MKRLMKRRFKYLMAILLILAITASSGLLLRQSIRDTREKEAENILFYYREKILLQMQGTMNEANALARTAYVMEKKQIDPSDWFHTAAEPLLKREEVRLVCLFKGDVMASALPQDKFGNLVGRDLQEFSYIYTLAKVVKDLVVEGPVLLENDTGQEEVFLFLQPILMEDAYMGLVAVALDKDYVFGQMGLDELYAKGYDYELWRVEPQNGNKEVIAGSRTDTDFSQAQKTNFYLPTEWTLSIQPADGWLSSGQRLGLSLLCVLLAAFLLLMARLIYRNTVLNRTMRKTDYEDKDTGLYNRKGFTAALDGWLSDTDTDVMLFYFSIEGYTQAIRLIGPEEEAAFLKNIRPRMDDYIHSPYISGRLDAGGYVVAVQEKMEEQQREDFAKGLSLELLMQVRIDGEKSFLMARYQYAVCRPGSGGAEEELSKLICAYYHRVDQESPIRKLTEKCRQLIEGKNDVTFDEYTDMDMMELSKTFNQYRKQVEQLAYTDPMFHVGNRPKFLRDANMLISYDKKRRFSLYCLDICSFSQYNELFSANIGDEILHEVLRRLSRPFGAYVYRINGDVFLGVSLSNEGAESFVLRLQKLFSVPIMVGSLSFPLQVRIAACLYPEHGETPGTLLDHIQSALRFAKESDQLIAIYNERLEEIIRTEADILRRMKEAIGNGTLEVWYQPIMLLEEGRYRAAEALVRLPDGKGGYFSAGQVISLAERNGIVEELGDYVLTKACAFMKEQGDRLGIQRIGINLSVQQLLLDNSAGHLLELIRSTGVDLNRITLEITESILIQSIDRASKTLEKLRQAGAHIALDDFGVGYSSLNYLSNLPVDIIKIDRSLTQQILTQPKQYKLLKTIVDMASINGLVVVAEGVETEAEQKAIAASGLQYIQGYYYARPMSDEKLMQSLQD